MIEVFSIIISALITNNVVFSQTMGICPFLGVSKKTGSAVGMGLAVTLVVVLSSLISWIVNSFVLIPLDIEYLQLIVYILIIACIVQMLDIVLKKFMPALYNSLGIYLALIATNCVVLGTAINVATFTLTVAFFTSLFTGFGFLLALVLMAGVRERMDTANIPKFFKGFPITLIAAAIMALAFYGFSSFSFTIGG